MSGASTGVSVVVPTRNSAATLAGCLDSIRRQVGVNVELIVVDNASSDTTVAIATELADVVFQRGPERCAQRNAGAAHASHEVIVFIDSDMELETGVCAQAAAVLAADPAVGAVVLPEVATGEGFWASCRSLEKELYIGDPNVEAARAYRRAAFEAIGGWDESLTACEDWDLEDRLRAAGWTVGRTAARVVHQEGRIQLTAQFAKKRYYGQWATAYLTTRPDGRRRVAGRALFRQPTRLARHPVRTGGLAVLKSVEVAGIIAGSRDARRPPTPVTSGPRVLP